MMDFLIIPLCSLLMRIKGGGVIPEKAPAAVTSSIGFGVAMYLLFGMNGIILSIAWFIAIKPGLGEYLGNLRGDKNNNSFGDHKSVVKIMDFLFEKLNIKITKENIQSFYGYVGTLIRGAMTGFPISLASLSFYPFLFSLLMPICYKVGFILQEKYPNFFKKGTEISGWAMGEWFYGATIGVGVWMSL